jgi:hypothetical protein
VLSEGRLSSEPKMICAGSLVETSLENAAQADTLNELCSSRRRVNDCDLLPELT